MSKNNVLIVNILTRVLNDMFESISNIRIDPYTNKGEVDVQFKIGALNNKIIHFKIQRAEFGIEYEEDDFKRLILDLIAKAEEEPEAVDHPNHYGGKDNPYEAIKVIENWGLGFCLGNTVKYISRAGKKERDKKLQDLKKAAWYLNREIERMEPGENKDV